MPHDGCAYEALMVAVDGQFSWFCNKCGRAGDFRIESVSKVALLWEVGPDVKRSLHGIFTDDLTARTEYAAQGPPADGWRIEVETFSVAGVVT